MNQDCDACKFLAKPAHPILLTKYWNVELGNNQAYLGRAYVSLIAHKGSLSKLSTEEWEDFRAVVLKLESAYRKAFVQSL